METTTPNEDRAMEEPSLPDNHVLGTWTRIYLHGLLALLAIFVVAYVVTFLLPVFDVTGNRPMAIALTVLTILFGPPIVGSLIVFGLFPMLGKRENWRGLLGWDDRLITEVAKAKEKAQIVMINWPTSEVRTMGVLTATFAAKDKEQQLAAVYVPTAPQTKLGYIRIVALKDVEFTDWTFKQWQLYQFTFGAASPGQLHLNDSDD